MTGSATRVTDHQTTGGRNTGVAADPDTYRSVTGGAPDGVGCTSNFSIMNRQKRDTESTVGRDPIVATGHGQMFDDDHAVRNWPQR